MQGHECAALLLSLLTLWLHPLLIHLSGRYQRLMKLYAWQAQAPQSAKRGHPAWASVAIWAWHMLQPWGQQPLEAATLHDPISRSSLKSKTHLLSGTLLEQSWEPALPVSQGIA